MKKLTLLLFLVLCSNFIMKAERTEVERIRTRFNEDVPDHIIKEHPIGLADHYYGVKYTDTRNGEKERFALQQAWWTDTDGENKFRKFNQDMVWIHYRGDELERPAPYPPVYYHYDYWVCDNVAMLTGNGFTGYNIENINAGATEEEFQQKLKPYMDIL